MKRILQIVLGLIVSQQALAHELFDIQKVGSRSYFVKTKSGKSSEAGSNSGFILLKNSILVIDAHISPKVEKSLIAEIQKISTLPIRYLVVTHPHKDHMLGEPAHGKNVIRVKKQADLPLHESIRLLNFGASHSSQDLVVYDTKDKVAFMGDLFVNGYVGYLAEANFKNWIKALQEIENLNPLKVAPGHGLMGKAADLRYYRIYLEDFVNSANIHFDQNRSVKTYQLPTKYQKLGAQFFLENNVKHAFHLWSNKRLK